MDGFQDRNDCDWPVAYNLGQRDFTALASIEFVVVPKASEQFRTDPSSVGTSPKYCRIVISSPSVPYRQLQRIPRAYVWIGVPAAWLPKCDNPGRNSFVATRRIFSFSRAFRLKHELNLGQAIPTASKAFMVHYVMDGWKSSINAYARHALVQRSDNRYFDQSIVTLDSDCPMSKR